MKELTGGIYAQEMVQYDGSGNIIAPTNAPVLAAGENFAGKVGSPADIIEVQLVLDTNAYQSGDVLAITALVNGVARVVDGLAEPYHLLVLDEDDQGQPFDLLFFRSNVSIGTINNAFSISDEGARDLMGWIRVASTDYEDFGGFRIATLNVNSSGWHMGLLETVSASRNIYIAAISRGTGTYTSGGLKLKFSVGQN